MPVSAEPPSPMVPAAVVKQPLPLPLLLAWIGSFVAILALLSAAMIWREAIMHAWPPSLRLYDLFRLTARP